MFDPIYVRQAKLLLRCLPVIFTIAQLACIKLRPTSM